MKIQPGLSEEDYSTLDEIDKLLGHTQSPGLQFSAIENMKSRISIFSIAQRYTNTLADRVLGDFRKSHSLSNLVATPFSRGDCASYLLSATETSLIDAVHSLWIVLNISDRFDGFEALVEKYLDRDIYGNLKKVMTQTQSLPLPDINRQESSATLGEDASLSYYRTSAAFLEYRALCQYRNDLDRVIGYRLVHNLLTEKHERGDLSFDDIDVLMRPNSEFRLDLHGTRDVAIDAFYRTYLFLRLLENPENLASLQTSEVTYIFDNTVALEALLHESELKTMHLNGSPDAQALISVLALALYRSKALDPDVDFDFRETLEQYILEHHQGDILEFIDTLSIKSPQVAHYVATSLDEATLQKMYNIIDSPAKSDSVRRDILNSIGLRLNKIEYIIEAEAIETRAKVSKLKQYFDSSRMFVDSVAMRKWLIANPSAYTEQYKELLPKITARLASIGNLVTSTGEIAQIEVIELQLTDERLVAQIAKDAFKEFCTNNEFGIESYLGRRIRHNTLHGVMTKSVDDVLQRPEFRPVLVGTPFGRAVEAWEHFYRSYIERMRKEFLQFKQHSKPNALFDGAISLNDQTTQRNLRQIVNSLRATGAEMLQDQIISFCWLQIAPQLEFASNQIRVRMAQTVLSSLESFLSKFNGPEELKIKNALMDGIRSTFTQVASWFQVPQTGFVPASISDICHIIDIEYGRGAVPTVVEGDSANIKYFGISVHRIYDCLAVLLQNAFKHGKLGSIPIVNVRATQLGGTNLSLLRLSVLSILPEDNASDCEARLVNALNSSETGRDMVNEGYSGLKKVKFITKMNEGVSTVAYTVVGDTLEVSFQMKAEVAMERGDTDENPTNRG